MVSLQKIIELTEYQTSTLPPANFSKEAAKLLHQHYRPQVTVNLPSFKNDYRWELTAQGWVGYLPLTPEVTLLLQPKVPLSNLFHMLMYAYNLKSFRFLDGLVDCQSLTEFYERLAHILAQGVLDRGRRGFYRAYLPRTEPLPYVRGRLNVRETMVPGRIQLACHYEEQTADIEDNQLLAWTLFCIARSGIGMKQSLPIIRQAYRTLQGAVMLTPHPAEACLGRLYHRLNDDYQPLHALCRFFLEQSGPSHQAGDHRMLPFLVDMARLYERFVAEWLKRHCPPGLMLKIQEKVSISQTNALHFDIDLVLYDAETGLVRYVLDTKYKTETPAADDIHQMISYAHTKGCSEAILIYPTPLSQPLDETIRGIRVRSLSFALEDDLEKAGEIFLHNLHRQE